MDVRWLKVVFLKVYQYSYTRSPLLPSDKNVPDEGGRQPESDELQQGSRQKSLCPKGAKKLPFL